MSRRLVLSTHRSLTLSARPSLTLVLLPEDTLALERSAAKENLFSPACLMGFFSFFLLLGGKKIQDYFTVANTNSGVRRVQWCQSEGGAGRADAETWG